MTMVPIRALPQLAKEVFYHKKLMDGEIEQRSLQSVGAESYFATWPRGFLFLIIRTETRGQPRISGSSCKSHRNMAFTHPRLIS